MIDASPNLLLPYLQPSQAQKHVTHNEALRLLDAVVQLSVLDRNLSTPPSAPSEGDRYIVPDSPQAAWAGQSRKIAIYEASSWVFLEPQSGWRAEIPSEQRSVVFDGTTWFEPTLNTDNLSGVGVNTRSDAFNGLAVASEGSLFTHQGAGHHLKINKAGGSEVASLLFQSDWNGHAEMGLIGNENWSLKVSLDGGSWITALEVDRASGAVSGAAIQASPDDTTPGRIMRADYGYGPGNLLGAVTMSGGAPSGAVIESGSDVNGSYVRFADGTQICTHVLDFQANGNGNIIADWTFPIAFDTFPAVSMSAPLAGSSYVNCSPRDFGLFRQNDNPLTVSMTITGQEPVVASAEVQGVAVTAMGRWA